MNLAYLGQGSLVHYIGVDKMNYHSSNTMSVQIGCIVKSDRFNPHERITHVGGLNSDGTRWRLTQQDAISGIELGKYRFFVMRNESPVNVIVAVSRFGNKYLKTEADGETPNNLLSLPACPR